MKSQRFALICVAAIAFLSGCHCLPITERYNDRVDCIADHEGRLSPHNRPLLNVTRWGMYDGPACCRRNCCH